MLLCAAKVLLQKKHRVHDSPPFQPEFAAAYKEIPSESVICDYFHESLLSLCRTASFMQKRDV
jgi:hypothetical protein